MKMEYFNHYTINTKHSRMSKPEDVSKKMYFILNNILKQLIEEEQADILDGTYAKLTIEPGCYAMTLYCKYNNQEVPLLTTIGCDDESQERYINSVISDLTKKIEVEASDKIYLKSPFVADIIMPSAAVIAPEVFEWTGDFTKTFGWMVLSPESIRP